MLASIGDVGFYGLACTTDGIRDYACMVAHKLTRAVSSCLVDTVPAVSKLALVL